MKNVAVTLASNFWWLVFQQWLKKIWVFMNMNSISGSVTLISCNFRNPFLFYFILSQVRKSKILNPTSLSNFYVCYLATLTLFSHLTKLNLCVFLNICYIETDLLEVWVTPVEKSKNVLFGKFTTMLTRKNIR